MTIPPPPDANLQKSPKPIGLNSSAPWPATGEKNDALDDTALVERFNRTGDESAFEAIVRRHYARIVAVARQALNNSADAQDIAQETFIRAHRGLANFRGTASLTTWLCCIALNLSRNRYWYLFRRRRYEMFSIDQSMGEGATFHLADVLPDNVPDPRLETINNEFVALVAQCMKRLDPCCREILALRNVLHHSYEEIGAALGLTVGTVKSRIARARARLRALILKDAPDFGGGAEMREFFEPALRLSGRWEFSGGR